MASDKQVQKEILEVANKTFESSGWANPLDADDVVDIVTDNLDSIDENDVDYQINVLDGNYYIEHSPSIGNRGYLELQARGIDQLHRLGGSTILETDLPDDLLEFLYEYERENPRSPRVSRNNLLDELSADEDNLDCSIWYLKEKGLVDPLTQLGNPPYHSATITDNGRRMYKSS